MLRRSLTCSLALRRNISALFQTGDKVKENFILFPFLNIEERLKNFDEIQENIRRRNLSTDLNELKSEHSLFSAINDRKKAMQDRREELHQKIETSSSESSTGLKIQAKQLREDLKQLKESSYYLEDTFVHRYLNLPNIIHENTPDIEKKIVYSFNVDAKRHERNADLKLVDELIEFYDPACYYMKGEAAKFDLFMPMHVLNSYRDKGFVVFSNPDFIRSIIAEAAGIENKDIFLLKEDNIEQKLNLLHLTGNASFLNFLPYISKLSTFSSALPLNFVSTGKQYDARNHFDHQDLFNVVQSTCCQTFIATADETSFKDVMDQQVDRFVETFEKFQQHFRIVYYPAEELTRAESCKMGVEMFSHSRNSYIEVGNFSYYGDYISQRLLFNYKTGKEFHFPHIYSGTVVNVMKLLLILIENTNEFKCPSWLD